MPRSEIRIAATSEDTMSASQANWIVRVASTATVIAAVRDKITVRRNAFS